MCKELIAKIKNCYRLLVILLLWLLPYISKSGYYILPNDEVVVEVVVVVVVVVAEVVVMVVEVVVVVVVVVVVDVGCGSSFIVWGSRYLANTFSLSSDVLAVSETSKVQDL